MAQNRNPTSPKPMMSKNMQENIPRLSAVCVLARPLPAGRIFAIKAQCGIESGVMTRRAWLALAMLLAACAKESRGPSLPEQLPGGWTRGVIEGMTAAQPTIRAMYSGPGKVTATVTEMAAAGLAFEAVQKWRPEKGKLAFQKDRWFVVLESADLDAGQLNSFAAALEKALG